MVNSTTDHSRKFLLIGCLVLIATLMGGCATAPVKPPTAVSPPPETPREETPPAKAPPVTVPKVNVKTFDDFIAVIADEKDTLSSLAAKYLNDPSMDWLIAEFNDISALQAGQALVIPLKPYERGGLRAKGYQTVPVLSYHNFARSGPNRATVTQAAFEEQMELLKTRGYHVITLDQLYGFLDFKTQIPKKSVVITIDDGWRSAYDIAFPVLKKYGYPATLFVYTDLIVGSEKTLSWDLLQEMADNGIDMQCHTKTHRKLTAMDSKESFKTYFEAIEKELVEAARIIKKRLNKDVKYLAYPYGETNSLIVELLKKYGYRGALTVKRGGNPFFADNFRVNRSMVYGEFDLKQFENNLPVSSDEGLR